MILAEKFLLSSPLIDNGSGNTFTLLYSTIFGEYPNQYDNYNYEILQLENWECLSIHASKHSGCVRIVCVENRERDVLIRWKDVLNFYQSKKILTSFGLPSFNCGINDIEPYITPWYLDLYWNHVWLMHNSKSLI